MTTVLFMHPRAVGPVGLPGRRRAAGRRPVRRLGAEWAVPTGTVRRVGGPAQSPGQFASICWVVVE